MPDTILVVDDEANIRILCAEALREAGHEVLVATSGAEAVLLLEASPVDIVLTDMKMPGMTGLELLRTIRGSYAGVDVIVMTAFATVDTAVEALKQGAHDYVVKPFAPDDLTYRVNRLSERRALVADSLLLRNHLDTGQGPGGLVGTSAVMRQIYRTILKVAPRKEPVLITGETGTGKEVVARAIHESSRNAEGEFVPVDCASLSPSLIESELFGHAPGAFTGASGRRTGLLPSAGRGTVFLDEIGELPLEMQPKLLRAIQERQVRAVGSNRAEPFEARIIAGTNRNLESSVQKGEFRSDLYFRLHVHAIHLPPLRDRKADIPHLVRHFIERAAEPDDGVSGVSKGAMRQLIQHTWPGNVRELQNQIARAIALSDGPLIQEKDLGPAMCTDQRCENATKPLTYLEAAERRAIAEMLTASSGHKGEAARLLGISRTTLYKKMKDFGLEEGF